VPAIFYILIMVFTALALVADIRTRKIPNWLNVTGFVTGLLFHGVTQGLVGMQFSLAGFATGFGILFLLWIMGGGGGGDVKLMGAVGAWMGPTLTVIVFVFSGILTGIGQVGLLLMSQNSAKRTEDVPVQSDQRRKLPYAVPVAIATWIICGLKLVNS
jgi:prepilin peptidase CpaA